MQFSTKVKLFLSDWCIPFLVAIFILGIILFFTTSPLESMGWFFSFGMLAALPIVLFLAEVNYFRKGLVSLWNKKTTFSFLSEKVLEITEGRVTEVIFLKNMLKVKWYVCDGFISGKFAANSSILAKEAVEFSFVDGTSRKFRFDNSDSSDVIDKFRRLAIKIEIKDC